MLLKFIEESGKVILVSSIATVVGAIGGIGYLIKNGFKCAVDHIDPGVSVDFSKINYTQAFEYFFHQNGTLNIPVSVKPSVDAVSCEGPVIAGIGIGMGVGCFFLASHYGRRYQEHSAKKRGQMDDFTSESPRASLFEV